MTQDLQQLLEKIQRDGVEKAKAEADKIVADARVKAKAAIDEAHAEAAKIKSAARQEAEAFEHRAEETVHQAARDTLLNVEKAVTALLVKLLRQDVNAALNDRAFVAGLAADAVHAYLSGNDAVTVDASAQLADTLRAKLVGLAADGVTVVTDENTGAGFRIKLANGRVEHDFTGAAIADVLAKGLRPRLAALLK
jgi:V/A-type H+-transporting ATPase subunit E